jgi:hypothetical protein
MKELLLLEEYLTENGLNISSQEFETRAPDDRIHFKTSRKRQRRRRRKLRRFSRISPKVS